MTAGFQALTHSAALIDLSSRTRIRLTGDDRARLLHALTTNHIQQLLPGHGCYAFFLNANGRILADANIFAFPDNLLIDAEPISRELLWNHIDHYIIADDVNPYDDSDLTFCLGVEGPRAVGVLRQLGAPLPGNAFEHAVWNDLTVAHVSHTGATGFRIFGPIGRKSATIDLLYLSEATQDDADTVRIQHGRPVYGVDISASNIAAETGLTHALHFQKGCYLGQEIVERVRSRGHINKRLAAFEIDSRESPAPRTRIHADGKEVGEITSAAALPTGKVAALGYIRVPHDKPGSLVEVEGAPGHVKSAVSDTVLEAGVEA